jgi:hypothetical protein
MRVNFNVINQKQVPALRSGDILPAAGQIGRIFFNSQGVGLYIDDGTQWLPITTGGAAVGNLQLVTDNGNTTSNPIVFIDGATAKTLKIGGLTNADTEYLLADAGGIIPMTVNGTSPDNFGNIELSGSSQNFANTNLTFDGNRIHNLNGFDLQISSNQGANTIYFDLKQNRLYTYTLSDEGGQSYFIVESGNDGSGGEINRIDLIVYSNLGGKSARINLQDGCIDIYPTDGLKINGSVGASGQVLTSAGNNASPFWADGGAGSVPTLQQVTNIGNITNVPIVIENSLLFFTSSSGASKYINGSFFAPVNDQAFNLPDVGGIIPISVNGVTADSNGNIELSSGAPTLQQVMDSGKTTNQNIELQASQINYIDNNGGVKFLAGYSLNGLVNYVGFLLPDVGGVIPISVNGITADSNGNIELSGGLVGTLQEVTDAGNITTQNIVLNDSNLRIQDTGSVKVLQGLNNGGAVGEVLFNLPDVGGTIPRSVNNQTADANGNITINTGGLYTTALTNIGESVNLIPATTRPVQRLIFTGTTTGNTTISLAAYNISLMLNMYGTFQLFPSLLVGLPYNSAGFNDGIFESYQCAIFYQNVSKNLQLSTQFTSGESSSGLSGSYTIIIEFQQV